jgi:poly(U)-specific endoribonuclease
LQDPGTPEDPTPQELEEQMAFMEEVMNSKVMKTAYDFIVAKGAYHGTYQDWSVLVYNLWFGQYGRFRANPGSSGFEHVFIGEIKKGEVSGFHNWFHWYMLEAAGHINYLGYWEHVTFGDRGDGLSFTYTWDGVQVRLAETGFFKMFPPEAVWIGFHRYIALSGAGSLLHLPSQQVY